MIVEKMCKTIFFLLFLFIIIGVCSFILGCSSQSPDEYRKLMQSTIESRVEKHLKTQMREEYKIVFFMPYREYATNGLSDEYIYIQLMISVRGVPVKMEYKLDRWGTQIIDGVIIPNGE